MRTFLVAAACAILVVGATATVIGVVLAMGDSATSIFELEAGDCFDLPEFGDDGSRPAEWREVDRVRCADPHTVEVLVVGQLDPRQERSRPDDEALFAEVAAACAGERVAADRLGFGLLPIVPNAAVWEPRGGPYLCVAIPYGGDPRPGSIVAQVVAATGGR